MQEARKEALEATRAQEEVDNAAEEELESDFEDENVDVSDALTSVPDPGAQEPVSDSASGEDTEDSFSSDSEESMELPEVDPLEIADPRVKVLTVLELEDLFIRSAPDLSRTCFLVTMTYVC